MPQRYETGARSMESLKRVLLKEYGSFSDRRIKRIERGHLFIVDDRTPRDVGADRQLYLWFCTMFADVVNDTEVLVELGGGVPMSLEVRKWAYREGAELADRDAVSTRVVFSIARGEQSSLLGLASAIRAITQSGGYSVPSYKYVCPRTASSLERLKGALDRALNARSLGCSDVAMLRIVANSTF
jgi:hypothetical protein